MNQPVKAVVLAAGKGTRLQTEDCGLPKVLRQAAGKPLLRYVVSALSFLPKEDIILVVGWKADTVREAFPGYSFALQEEQLGTGHAVRCATPLLQGFEGHVLICCGDAPLMRAATFRTLIDTHRREGNSCTMLSARVEDGGSYGRILRKEDGAFSAIVEAKDCTPRQRGIREVNTGTYVFSAPALLAGLGRLRPDNAQGEYYLTDLPALMEADGKRVGLCDTCSAEEMLGVNTLEQLQEVEFLLRQEGTNGGT